MSKAQDSFSARPTGGSQTGEHVRSQFSLAGKTALVTGGTGGLGAAMAEALRTAGARVAVVRRSEVSSDASANGVIVLSGNLVQPGESERVVQEAIAELGGLDILIAAHGTARRSAAEDFPRADWDATLETNLTSVFTTVQAAGRRFLQQRRGKIILVASMLSFGGGMRASAYAASKGGVAQLTKALANEWASQGINVNAIAPGYFETPMTQALRDDPVRNRQILDRLPAGRWGRPSELAGAVVFLASPASDYVHGIVLPVDGGWLAR